MKQIFIMAILVASFADIQAASPSAKPAKDIHKTKPQAAKSARTAARPAREDVSTASDFSYIGTNDFNLALVREGIKKA